MEFDARSVPAHRLTKEKREIEARVSRRRGRPANDASHAVPEETVLDLAFETFAQRGFEGTTVRELAKRLGVSHNLLNVRFGTKDDLWRRAVDSRVARFGGPVFAAFDERGLDAESRLRLLVHRFCAWAAENPDFVGLSHAEGRRATWRLDYLVDLYIGPFKRQLDRLFAEVAAVRDMRALSSSAFMAMLVQGTGFYFASGAMLEAIGDGDELAPERVAARVDELTQFLIAGLLGHDAGAQAEAKEGAALQPPAPRISASSAAA